MLLSNHSTPVKVKPSLGNDEFQGFNIPTPVLLSPDLSKFSRVSLNKENMDPNEGEFGLHGQESMNSSFSFSHFPCSREALNVPEASHSGSTTALPQTTKKSKSPLPESYPRVPLQDITDIVNYTVPNPVRKKKSKKNQVVPFSFDSDISEIASKEYCTETKSKNSMSSFKNASLRFFR